jgi:hypothetical protein
VTARLLALGSSLLIVLASVAPAQSAESTTVRPLRARGAGAVRMEKPGKAARVAAQGRGGAGNQQALARQVRQAFAGVVRKKLSLNDDQARQLQQSDRKFTQQRNQVLQSERQARLGLKAAMEDSSGARDQTRIDQYMSQLVQAQHRRADILEAEQKEMAGYLTPLQRAQYQALHEQLNKRITQLRQADPPTR